MGWQNTKRSRRHLLLQKAYFASYQHTKPRVAVGYDLPPRIRLPHPPRVAFLDKPEDHEDTDGHAIFGSALRNSFLTSSAPCPNLVDLFNPGPCIYGRKECNSSSDNKGAYIVPASIDLLDVHAVDRSHSCTRNVYEGEYVN